MPVWSWVRTRWAGSWGQKATTTQMDADAAGTTTEVLDLLADLRGEIGQIHRELDVIISPAEPITVGATTPSGGVVDVRVLGGFSVFVDDRAVEWSGRRASRNLFQLLLQRHPQPINREVLMEALWPEADPASARNRLNVALHDLRKQLRAAGVADDIVVHEGPVYRLNPGIELRIDETEFIAGVDVLLDGSRDLDADAVDRLSAVVGLYQGDYLGTEPYEEWTMERRRYLRRLYISAQDVIARARLEEGRLEACIDACRRITEIEEAHEVAHRRMITALARAGRVSEALLQFDICADNLADGLGVEPSEQTLQLIRDIRSGAGPRVDE